MNRSQIENIYYANGLGELQLRNMGDLMKIYGINAKTVDGYSKLNDKDKRAYLKFIIKYMNCLDLEERATFFPLRIYRAEDVRYLISEEGEYLLIGEEVWDVTDEDNKIKVKEWIDEEEMEEGYYKKLGKEYLRIEYMLYDREKSIHIVNNGDEWY